MHVREDPIFEPWSTKELQRPRPLPHAVLAAQSADTVVERSADEHLGPEDHLRSLAAPLLEVVSRRLRLARHDASVDDLLEAPERLIRFRLDPWPGPFQEPGSARAAMLEIAVGGEDVEVVTAWYWLDGLAEAPQTMPSVSTTRLTASWVERTILDFVGKVLEGS